MDTAATRVGEVSADLSLRQQLATLQLQYRHRRWRLPLWLQVDARDFTTVLTTELCQVLSELLTDQAAGAGFWLGDAIAQLQLPEATTTVKHKGQLLGVEADWIVINGLAGIDWDLLAASSGCLRAGGLWLMITTLPSQFALQPNPLAQRLLSYPLLATAQPGKFQQFWLGQQHSWWICSLDPQQQRLIPPAPRTILSGDLPTEVPAAAPAMTADPATGCQGSFEQQQAIAAILKVVSGHRRRPLLLTAHRGRGKSTALGLAAAYLQQLGKTRLIITAPQPAAAAVALQHAAALVKQLLPNAAVALQFWPVDLLLQQKPAADLIMVDEAAAIPLPQLQQLTQHYSRLVFATTEHGYEGTGRSFSLKFQPYLHQHCPGWRKLRLQQPIRYAMDDPLEQQIFDSFLLACDQPTPTYDPALPIQTRIMQTDELLAQPALLASLFGLLSLAHYQTDVSDLWALLDNPQLQLMALYQTTALPSDALPAQIATMQLLGCAVVSAEGQFPMPLATQVYQGERRVQGHLLAQSLAFHLATPELATLPLARVQRIVIHPACQNAGLGRRLLMAIQAHCRTVGFAAVGSSFGATPALVRFWTSQGFQPVKLSAQADQSSGEPSMLVVKSCHQQHQHTIDLLQQQFASDLYWQLADSQQQLDPALALLLCQPPTQMMSSILVDPDRSQLSAQSVRHLQLFVQGQRPYELVELILMDWFQLHRHQLPSRIAQLLVQKLWQKQSWATLSISQTGQGKAQLITQIRQAIAELLTKQPAQSSGIWPVYEPNQH